MRRLEAGEAGAQAWYVAEGTRAEQLLHRGAVGEATEVFEGILTRLGDTPSYGRAVVLGRLGRCCHMRGQPDLAIRHLRTAIDVLGRLAPSDGVKSLRGTLRSELGDALRAGGAYGEAKKAYEAALKVAQELSDLRAQGVELSRLGALALTAGDLDDALTRHQAARRTFELLHERELEAAAWHQLAKVHHAGRRWDEAERHYREAARISEQRGHLLAAAHDWILADLACEQGNDTTGEATRIGATLARVGDAPTFGRAVILGQVARFLQVQGRSDLALACEREAGHIASLLPPGSGAGGLADAVSEAGGARSGGASGFELTVVEDVSIDYVFDTDLLVEGPRVRRTVPWSGDPPALADGLRPMLPLGTRTWMESEGSVRVSLPPGEPIVDRHDSCTEMRRVHREIAISGSSSLVWQLIRRMDAALTVAEILSGLPASEHVVATRMFAALASLGAIDVSGRAVGRFLHMATKKGVLPAGGLEGDAVLRLATDGNYREYPGAARIAVDQSVPDRLRTFHALTRSRRSSRDYSGRVLERADFDALLHTACGVTGAMPWAGREVKLRAYPSSGALYAVEIYPVVFRVEGLEPAVYHYRAVDSVLEVVTSHIDPSSVVGAALPIERDMLARAAALVCLTGSFLRHERKYGQGGYRMLVAEAGHISQNLVLAATALGLNARPFGGVFDDVLNHDLGLEGTEEQFLLAVIVGHGGDTT